MVIIRDAGSFDTVAISDIHQRACNVADRRLGRTVCNDDSPLQRWTSYLQDLAAIESLVRVAVEHERIVGFTTSVLHRSEDGHPTGEVESLYVDPKRYGAGVGKKLLDDAVQSLQRRGCSCIFLYSDVQDSLLQAWYKSYGTVKTGEIINLPGNRIPHLCKLIVPCP